MGQFVLFFALIAVYIVRPVFPLFVYVIIGLLCFICFTTTIFWKCPSYKKLFSGAYSPFLGICMNGGKTIKEVYTKELKIISCIPTKEQKKGTIFFIN